MLNKVQIIGRLGSDPETRYSQSGQPNTSLRIATDESYRDRDGNRVERTEWHRVVTFGRTAENCAQYLSKGSLVYVEGKLATRKWNDQTGQERYTTEIKAERVQFLEKRENVAQQPAQRQERRRIRASDEELEDLGPVFPSEPANMDDIPF